MSIKDTASEKSEKMRYVLLESGKKDYHHYTVAQSLAELCLTARWKAKPLSNEVGYLPGYISKQSIEELLNKKEPRLHDLEYCQPIQIAKDAKIRKFTVLKVCSGQRAKDVAHQLFDSDLERQKISECSVTTKFH